MPSLSLPPARPSLSLSQVKAVVDALGMTVCDKTDQARAHTRTHTHTRTRARLRTRRRHLDALDERIPPPSPAESLFRASGLLLCVCVLGGLWKSCLAALLGPSPHPPTTTTTTTTHRLTHAPHPYRATAAALNP